MHCLNTVSRLPRVYARATFNLHNLFSIVSRARKGPSGRLFARVPDLVARLLHFTKAEHTLRRRDRRKGPAYALDNLCGAADSVAARNGQLIHTGGIHSHSAGDRPGDADHQSVFRPQTRLTQSGCRQSKPGCEPGLLCLQRSAETSVVVLESEMRDQFLAAQVAQRVLELHQLNEQIVFRVEPGRAHRTLEIE